MKLIVIVSVGNLATRFTRTGSMALFLCIFCLGFAFTSMSSSAFYDDVLNVFRFKFCDMNDLNSETLCYL